MNIPFRSLQKSLTENSGTSLNCFSQVMSNQSKQSDQLLYSACLVFSTKLTSMTLFPIINERTYTPGNFCSNIRLILPMLNGLQQESPAERINDKNQVCFLRMLTIKATNFQGAMIFKPHHHFPCQLVTKLFKDGSFRVGINASWFVNHDSVFWSHEPKICKLHLSQIVFAKIW